jgi:hypothetical protein
MNCVNHSDRAAVAYCRTCGKALCNACSRNVGGVIYCETCVVDAPPVAPKGFGIPPSSPHINPPLAGFLGLIPGVGAMYNGQFMKGVIHVLVFVSLVVLTTHYPLVGMLIGFSVLYMAFDAFKTAEAMQHGLPLPDPFGLEATFGPGVNQTSWQRPAAPSTPNPVAAGATQQVYEAQQHAYAAQQEAYAAQEAARATSCNNSVPIGAVVLIGLGCLFLLDNMGWFSFSVDRFWPVILIVIGAWLLFKRWTRRVS